MKKLFLTLTCLSTIYATNLVQANETELSEGQLKDIVERSTNIGKKLGEGAFGIVYPDPQGKYVVKCCKSDDKDKKEEFLKEGNRNKKLFNDIAQLDEDQVFYKETMGFITKYHGKLEKDGKVYFVFERAKGDEFAKLLDIEQFLLPAYNEAYSKLMEEGHKSPTKEQIKEKIKNMSEEELFPSILKKEGTCEGCKYKKRMCEDYRKVIIKLLDKIDSLNFEAMNKQSFQARVKRNLLVQAQLADALAVEHDAGKVHLDVKPGNTMVYIVGKYSNNPSVYTKLIDHGLVSDLTDPEDANRKAGNKGTPLYMAPEELYFNKNEFLVEDHGVSPAADVYSHAMSTLHALFGATPFWVEYVDGYNLGQIPGKRADQLLFKALEKKDFLVKQKEEGKLQAEYSDLQLKFLNQLFRDCLNPNPAERPSMAQVGELLQILLSTFSKEEENIIIGGYRKLKIEKSKVEKHEDKKPFELDDNYDYYQNAKKIAELDRPKVIPMAIRNMIKSSDDEQRDKGFKVLDLLVKADPSYEVDSVYKATPSYGLKILEQEDYKEQHYAEWTKKPENKEAVDFLKKYARVEQNSVSEKASEKKRGGLKIFKKKKHVEVNGMSVPEKLPVDPIPVSQPTREIIEKY